MVRKVAETIAKHDMLRPGDRVGAAVSGGADSLALLHVLRELADELGIALAVAHFNHKLRGDESDGDERFVSELAAASGLALFTASEDVRAQAVRQGGNLEEMARERRYQWFTRLLDRGVVDKIAVGHTRSDQAETVLYRLVKGAGSAGLAGIRPVLGKRIVRPLIEVGRPEVLDYLQNRGEQWREDRTNQSEKLARNRIRHRLMPLLRQENPNVEAVLAHTAEWAREEEAYWSERLRPLVAQLVEEDSAGACLRTSGIANLAPAVQRRLLRAVIEKARGGLRGIGFEHVEALRALALRDSGTGRADLPGLQATRSFDRIRILRAPVEQPASEGDYCLPLEIPGTFSIPGGSSRLQLKLYPGSEWKHRYNGNWQRALDWERIPKPLHLRSWREGDRFRPQGRKQPIKLKSLFQKDRVPVWQRAHWPVVFGGGDAEIAAPQQQAIVWTRQFGCCADFTPNENSPAVLEIREVISDEADIL